MSSHPAYYLGVSTLWYGKPQNFCSASPPPQHRFGAPFAKAGHVAAVLLPPNASPTEALTLYWSPVRSIHAGQESSLTGQPKFMKHGGDFHSWMALWTYSWGPCWGHLAMGLKKAGAHKRFNLWGQYNDKPWDSEYYPANSLEHEILWNHSPGIPWNKHPQTLVACASSIHFRIPYQTVCYYSISVYAYIHKL